MLFKSGLVTQASGSFGGLTASHNRGGMYLRARTIPTDPATEFQTVMRANMQSLANHWLGTLTPAQREGWATYAANVTLTGPLGDQINVSGMNMYCRSNLCILQAGMTRVDGFPTVFTLGEFTLPTAIAGDGTANEIDVTFLNTDEWANEDDAAMLVYGSREQNPTINFFKGPYRLAGTIDGDSVTPPTSPAAITSAFNLTADNYVHSMVRVVRADGRLSAPFRTRGIIV